MTVQAPPLDLDRAERLARELAAGVTTRRIYAEGHQRTVAAIDRLVEGMQAELSAPGRRFVLTTHGGVLSYEGIPLLRQGSGGPELVARLLESRKCGGLIFHGQLSREVVCTLIDWLAEGRPQPLAEQLPGIDILPPGAGDETGRELDALGDLVPEFKLVHKIHKTANSVIEHVMDDFRAGRKADFTEIVELTKWTAEAAYSEGAALLAPTQTKHHDSYTFNHSVNVFLISTALLQPFARDRKELARFSQAALLHDVGKSRVPRDVLYKKGSLTEEEFALIKQHPVYGAEILQKCRHADPLAVEVAYCHHMRDDGYGYPTPKLPIKPGPVADLVQVSDMFEALTAHRPYSKGVTAAQALEKILATPGMGSKRAALTHLFERLTASPPGSQVRLSTGERGLVLKTHPNAPGQPLIRVFEDAEGKPLADAYLLDLREAEPGQHMISEVSLKPSLIRTAREANLLEPK